MWMDSTVVAPALMGLMLQVGGVDLNATYLHGDQSGCAIASQRAHEWRREGRVAIEQQVGKWCVVGTVVGDQWVAEQWDSTALPGRARGWRIRIPLRQAAARTAVAKSDWPLDLTDRHLGTRIRMRHSLQTLDDHHQASLMHLEKTVRLQAASTRELPGGRLTTFAQGQVLLSGKEPLLGSYSILIQR